MDNLSYRPGTPWTANHDPDGNLEMIDAAITGVYPQVVGTPEDGVTAVEYGDSKFHVTELTLTNVDLGAIAGAGNLAIGAKIYTFPAGVHVHEVTYMSVALQGATAILADTPDVGVGSVVGSGAVAVLGGTATFEDYITGQTAADVDGTATVAGPLGATAGILTGISLNAAADTKTVFLNAADGWAGASATVLATGTIVLKWTTIA